VKKRFSSFWAIAVAGVSAGVLSFWANRQDFSDDERILIVTFGPAVLAAIVGYYGSQPSIGTTKDGD